MAVAGETRAGEGGGVANTARELGLFQDADSVRDYVRSASLIKWRRGLTALPAFAGGRWLNFSAQVGGGIETSRRLVVRGGSCGQGQDGVCAAARDCTGVIC